MHTRRYSAPVVEHRRYKWYEQIDSRVNFDLNYYVIQLHEKKKNKLMEALIILFPSYFFPFVQPPMSCIYFLFVNVHETTPKIGMPYLYIEFQGWQVKQLTTSNHLGEEYKNDSMGERQDGGKNEQLRYTAFIASTNVQSPHAIFGSTLFSMYE